MSHLFSLFAVLRCHNANIETNFTYDVVNVFFIICMTLYNRKFYTISYQIISLVTSINDRVHTGA